MNKRWNLVPLNEKLQNLFVSELNILPLTAQLLINRNINDLESAYSYLKPDINNLHDPMLMKDMDKATLRLERALVDGERVAVYGDYDVDGTTATALLKLFLTELGFSVSTHIPERISEGYGLNNNSLKELAESGVKVVITTDCGVSNYDETVYANEIGMDVIITDHHEIPSRIPPALAIINPKQSGCAFPFKSLAGVGVAFNLAMGLRAHLKKKGHINEATQPNLKKYLDFVAIGTVADMVPLTDENRILVKYGIEQIKHTERPGIKALMAVSLIRDGHVTSEKISYQLAPRINAAGRVSRADIALELLTTSDKNRAEELATKLDNINSERKSLEADITAEALEMVSPTSTDKGIVLYKEAWHPGVVGIVASKISGRFTKPTVMIALDGDLGRGSARGGVANFDLLSALSNCDKYLEKYGGHKAAAGLTIHKDNIEPFKKAFIALLNKTIDDDDLTPQIQIDAVISLDEVNMGMVSEIERLSPFGISNREPVLGALDANIIESRIVGIKHLQLRLRHKGKPIKAIAFGRGKEHPIKGHGFDVAFSPSVDTWHGKKSLSLKIKDLRSTLT